MKNTRIFLCLGAACLAAFTTAHAAPAPKKKPALSKEAVIFLKSEKIDLESAEVKRAVADGTIKTEYDGDPVEYSLDQLAKAKKKNAVATFIGTRTFIAKLKADFAGTDIPKERYDPLYLTHDERDLVGHKFAERFKKK